jgi:acyl-coenzyme A synthetase/AMP-(fatty) acid ligase
VESTLTVTRHLAEGDELWMFVVLERDRHPLDEVLRRALVRELASVSGVTEEACRVFELSGLPVTRRGKVMGSELERLINHQALPNRARMKNPEIIGEIARVTHDQSNTLLEQRV